MKKRVLSMMMAIAMILSIMPVNVFAAETFSVATKEELTNAVASAVDGDTVTMTADIVCDSVIVIDKAITLDLGSYTLTTTNGWGGLQLKNGCSVKNGNLLHTGRVNAIKVWDVVSLEDLVIEVTETTEGKVVGGIAIQENAVGVDSIKNVTIKGEGLDYGIETYNCGNAEEPVIGAMENVTIDAVGTGMLLSAPAGTATNCDIHGDVSGIEIWIKGTYSASLDLVNCEVSGGEQAVFAHDEFNSADIENIGTITLTADEDTTFTVAEGGVKLNLVNNHESDIVITSADDEVTTPAKEYIIEDIEDLVAFRDEVNSGKTFEGYIVKLTDDIDLEGYTEVNVNYNGEEAKSPTFRPIGDHATDAVFEGTFDGQGHTISNLYQSGWDINYCWGRYGSLGLFGEIKDATIKNLTMEGAELVVEGGDVAAITGSATGECVFENINIVDCTMATYNNGCGSIIAWSGEGDYTFRNITIDEDTVCAALWGSFDSSVGGVVGQAEPGASYDFEHIDIACRLDVYNDCTASYDYYNYRMCGMIMGRLEKTVEIDGKAYPDPEQYDITMKDVNVTFGDWANYHYCDPTPGYNNGRGMRVEAGYAYDGLPEDYDHGTCTTAHMNLIRFTQLFGGAQYAVAGMPLDVLEDNYPTLAAGVDVEIENPGARIGDTDYWTLADAVAAAEAGDEIEVLADVEEAVVIEKDVTVEFNDNDILSTMELTAGTYDLNVSKYCAEGYRAIDNKNGTWTVANEDDIATYAVKHLLMTTEGKVYKAHAKYPYTGVAGKLTMAEAIEIDGYTAMTFEQQTVAADGSTVVEIQYAPNTNTKYYVKHLLMTTEGKVYKAHAKYPYTGTTNTKTKAEAIEIPGYTVMEFEQLRINGDGSTVVEIRYTPNTDTLYKVKHLLLNGAGDKVYKAYATYSYTGTTDTKTKAEALIDIPGYTAMEFEQLRINGDGSTIVEIYYSRNNYTLTYDLQGGVFEDGKATEQTVQYMKKIAKPADPVREGWTFMGWDIEIPATMPANDLTITAKWELNASVVTPAAAAYKVEHYQENLDGTWTLVETEFPLFGKLNEPAAVTPKTYTGFTYVEPTEGVLVEMPKTVDGELVVTTVQAYYARAEYDITINEAEGGKVVALVNGDEATAARYGEEVTFVVTPNEGWKLISMNYQVYNGGQIGGGNAASNPVIDMPAGNVVVKPVFEKIIYTITVAPCEHGTVVAKVNGVEANTATIDDVIEIEVTPEEGYQLQKLNYSFSLDVGGGAGGGLKIGESLPMRAGNVRISAVFEPIIYTITFKAGEHGTFADGVKEITVEAAYASAFPKAPELTADKHFAFTAWTPALPATVPLNGGTYTAQWTQVSTDPSVVEPAAAVYFVNHYVENEAGEYELKENERLTAKLGTTVTADSTKYVGTYHRVENNLSTLSGVVTFDKGAADPMATLLTLNVYYEKYATDITGPIAPVAAAYRVQYFTENLDGSYTLTDTQYKTGVIGESADATYTVPQNYKLGDTAGLTGIVYVPNAEGAASIDEVDMLTLKVYYDLNEYTVTFDSKGGTAVDNQTVKHGGKAAEPATPARSGYNFDGWCLDGKLFDFDTVITSDITLIALWDRERIAPASSVTYKITVDADGVTSSHSRARKGETVTLTVEDELEIVALDKDGDEIKLTYKNGKYTFKMPACAVTVKAVEKVIHNPFADVADDAYYTDAVLWALTEGITTGTGTDTFSPDAICTRAQVVTFLWRAAGEPAPKSAEMPFSDVTEGAYYYAAVLWAVENNITAGTSATTFSPDDNCTRAQIVTFLWRSQGFESASAYNPFTDVVSDTYYTEAVLWAVENGITTGTSATTFSPAADCTRGQIVTFLYRCLAE